jgi:glutaredoxin 2
MDISAKNKFETHYEILRKHYGVDKVPSYNGLKDFSKDDYINRCGNDGLVLRNFSDDDFEMLKTLSAFFDQRDKMTCKEFSNALIAEYGVALSIEKDVLEIEKFIVLSSLGKNLYTMKRIMVFFFVLGTISIIGTVLGTLIYFLA